jgi:hypothetical protein
MTIVSETRTVREAVAVFDRAENLQDAIDELLSSGFHRAALSLLASEQAVREKLGRHGSFASLADNPGTPRSDYVSPEALGDAEGAIIGVLMYVGAMAATGAVVASGGTLAALIIGTTLAGGGGALIGGIMAKFIGDHHAAHLQKQLDRGGLLLWVRAWNEDAEKTAAAILRKHSGGDVHIHELPVGAS